MHLALKSAMSRIPYTNKVGETLSSIADPAAAYSLRALGGGDPMVARVRRSSDDAEKDFTASDISGGILVNWVGSGNDGFVTSWYDQSGNDNHATQGTAGSQPKIVDGGTLVSDGIEFDGVDDFIYLSSSIALSNGTLFSTHNFELSKGAFGILSSVNGDYFGLFQSGTGISEVYRNFSVGSEYINGTLTPFTSRIVAHTALTGSKKIATFTGLGSVESVTELGRTNASNTWAVKGSISEIIIYDSDQSSNREAIETNINNYYDIY